MSNVNYTGRFKFGGKGSKSDNCLKILTPKKNSKYSITGCVASSSNSKTGYLYAEGASKVKLFEGSAATLIESTEVTSDAEGAIYIFCETQACNIYALSIEG